MGHGSGPEPSHSRNSTEIEDYRYSAHCFSLDFGNECLQRRKEFVNLYLTAYIMLWHKEASQLIGKKPKCYGIKKYRASKYPPLILKNYKSHLQAIEF